jgi:hypothetical protein
LSACGGGSSSKSATPELTPNTAPTMSGVFTTNAKAMQKTIAVFDIADVENDTLSLSISEQPEWLSFELSNNNQVTITIEPDFFDIENYELVLTLSDGKASAQYKLIVDVIDNPTKWQHVEITEQELVGTWSNHNGDKLALTFLENSRGVYFVDNKLVPLNWELDDVIVIDFRKPGCISDCGIGGFMEVALLAQEGNKLRVEIDIEDGVRQYINLTKDQSNSFTHESFISLPQIEFNSLSVIKVNEELANIFVNIEDISLGSNTFNRSANVAGSLINKSSHYDISLASSNKLLEEVTGLFYNYDSNQDEYLIFDVIIDNVELQPISSGYIFTKIEYHAELISNIDPARYHFYAGLENSLETKYSYDVLSGVSPINDVELRLNTNYAARLLPAISTDIDGVDYNGGASVFKFTNDKDGETKLKVAGENSVVTKSFSWSKDGGNLAITLDGTTRAHQFYTLPNGELGLSLTFKEDGVETSTSIYEFTEVTEDNVDIIKYIGQFEGHYLSFFGNSKNSGLAIGADGRGSVFYSNGADLDDFWKLEEDNSVSLIGRYNCQNAFNSNLDFDDCYAEAQANFVNGSAYNIRNYKLLSVIDDNYVFQYGLMSKSVNKNWAYESIRRFKKLAK